MFPGGSIDVWGGESTTTSSGAFHCAVNTGLDGGSGVCCFRPGFASISNSGAVCIGGGAGLNGRAGAISISPGRAPCSWRQHCGLGWSNYLTHWGDKQQFVLRGECSEQWGCECDVCE